MTIVKLILSYPQLSSLIQAETNKQEINIKGYDIKVDKLAITSLSGRLRVVGEIISKWNAYFDFSAKLSYDSSTEKIDLQDIKLDLDASHLIFRGILRLAKGNLLSRMEKAIERPISEQIEQLKSRIDIELSKAPLPHELQLISKTEHLKVLDVIAMEEALRADLEISQVLSISFNKQESQNDKDH